MVETTRSPAVTRAGSATSGDGGAQADGRDLARALAAEALGTAFLLAAVAGSGIMAERLAQGNGALALLANSLATGAALAALILAFAPLSGAHFNPLVTLAEAWNGGLGWRRAAAYLGVQCAGSLAGVGAAHLMFGLPLWSSSHRVRQGPAQWFSESLAAFGLLLVISLSARKRPGALPFAVGGYIMAAYWFTASTAFANPAATLARAFTDTFTGIRPADVAGFVGAQALGGFAAVLLSRWLLPKGKP